MILVIIYQLNIQRIVAGLPQRIARPNYAPTPFRVVSPTTKQVNELKEIVSELDKVTDLYLHKLGFNEIPTDDIYFQMGVKAAMLGNQLQKRLLKGTLDEAKDFLKSISLVEALREIVSRKSGQYGFTSTPRSDSNLKLVDSANNILDKILYQRDYKTAFKEAQDFFKVLKMIERLEKIHGKYSAPQMIGFVEVSRPKGEEMFSHEADILLLGIQGDLYCRKQQFYIERFIDKVELYERINKRDHEKELEKRKFGF